MINEVIILKNGLHAFHRIYTEMSIENIDIAGGFLQAIYQFSTVYIEDKLESINMSGSIYYFQMNNGFIFVLKLTRDSIYSYEQIKVLLKQLSDDFFHYYPDAQAWDGNSNEFDDFINICDKILNQQPTRHGRPFLLKIIYKPYFMVPITQLIPITTENQNDYYAVQQQLNKYAEQSGYKSLKKLFQGSFLIYLGSLQKLAYMYPFYQDHIQKDTCYVLCFITEEDYWFTIYQLLLLINTKAKHVVPILEGYIEDMEKNTQVERLKILGPKIQELIYSWANLNTYVGNLEAVLFEELIKFSNINYTLTEEQIRASLVVLLMKLGKDIDKLIFDIISQRQIVFVGYDQNVVQTTMNALLTFYPHPSVSLWSDEPTDVLLVGTHPSNIDYYQGKSAVIVDLDHNVILGGEKNDLCSALIGETKTLIQDISIAEARRYFQGKLSSIFMILKSLLEIMFEPEEKQKFQVVLKVCPRPMIRLIERMSEGFNPTLAKKIQDYS